eukprot:jgi/Tetstr1/420742/TSEL_011819.t1
MPIHGVRHIAEKLGPRAVTVHTDLRNPYNEAWRRTIIQRHVDCSPLHPVIPALMAYLSTDSFLLVDDRSAPLRSENGVQQGAPLATTSFYVAIHPEASVGLEVRFDKMHACCAVMEAARREAPARIGWPELDGQHNIPVLNVLGVSFDPSTYRTDTNPVVTDFLAELLHDPDLMAAEAATLSEDAVPIARSRHHVPARFKGGSIRRMATVRDAAFLGSINDVLSRFLTRNFDTNTLTPSFFDSPLESILGRGSFNATSSARRYDHFLNDAHMSGRYAAAVREAWSRLHAAIAGHLSAAIACVIERGADAASGSQKELAAFLD